MAAKIVERSGVLIALLVLSTSVAVAQHYDDDELRKMLIGLFETALLNDSDALWTLQEVFFNPDSKQSPELVCLSVSISVVDIADPDYNSFCDISSDDPENWRAFVYDDFFDAWYFNSKYELHQQIIDDASDTQELAKLITNSGSTSALYSFDPSFYSIMQTLSSTIALSSPYDGDSYNSNDNARIHIAINTTFDFMPCWNDAVYALRSVLMWAKFYARANINGTQRSKEETDRSSVSDGVRFSDQYDGTDQCQSRAANVLIQPSNTWILVICIFYFSNLLVLTSTLLYFRKVFLWLQGQKKQIKSLYTASAIVLTCVNIIALISDLYIVVSYIIKMANGNYYNSDLLQLIIPAVMIPVKVPLIFVVLILETPVACFNTHLLNDANQPNTRCQRFAHAFALCQIIWFVHRLISDAIISVIFFVLAPPQTLGIVTLLLATIVSAIAFVAILIHNFKGCNRKMCTYMICVTFNGLLICALLVAISLLYLILVDNGLKSAGMGGLVLSLVPPFAVFMIGLIINQKYFKSQKESPTSVTATPEPGREPNQTTAIQMDDNEEEESAPLLLQVRGHP